MADARSWQWVSGGYLAVGTERYIFAAQEQAGAWDEVGKEYQV